MISALLGRLSGTRGLTSVYWSCVFCVLYGNLAEGLSSPSIVDDVAVDGD